MMVETYVGRDRIRVMGDQNESLGVDKKILC